MKNRIKLIGFIALIAVFGLTMVALSLTGCDDGSTGGGGAPSETYTGEKGGKTYTLKITQARAISEGDGYVLTAGTRKSTGTVEYAAGGNLILQPRRTGAATFTAEVSDNGLTNVSGLIAFDTGDPEDGPGELTPVAPPAPPTPSGGSGRLTVQNLPSGARWGASVYDHSGAITKEDVINIVKDSNMIAGSGTSNATSVQLTNPSSLGGGTFSRTGTYLVQVLISNSSDTLNQSFFGQVTFTNGSATINWNDGINFRF